MTLSVLDPPCLRRWLLKSVFVLALVLPRSSGCPRSCACYVPSEVHCTFRYLNAIPFPIHTSVERINFGYNSITRLGEEDFSGLEHLELLMLHSNSIHRIEDKAFQDLKSLQVLKMSYNKVKELEKETFKGLDALLRLHMDHNRIEFISPEAFYGLTNLQLVHLEGNQLQQLHPDTFTTLRHSQVFQVSSVRNIHLSDNLLSSLPADIFAGCSQLENVFLHGNPWSCDCRMKWFPLWQQTNAGVLKCKRDRKYARGQLCPVCEDQGPYHGRSISQLPSDAFTCTKPWIHPHLKQRNITLDQGDFTPVSARDFIAPIGSMQLNLTDQYHNDASLLCTVQRPSAMENLTLTMEESNATMLTVGVATSLVCNIDDEHIQQLWRILATYSESPMRLERGLMLTRSPGMAFQYRQIRPEDGQEGIHTDIGAEIKASPAWLMQGEVSFQLDRTTTTYATLHIKYRSVVHLHVENRPSKRDRHSWTMIQRDNHTKTEHAVLTGGVAELNCHTLGNPKPSVEWILADGTKVRAPYSSEDGRILITNEGKLTLRGADISDTGLYRCIATNYQDADILSFRITVLSPDVEEAEVNGVQLSQPLGQNLVLDCGSTGSPAASVQWVLPDHSVLDTSHGNKKVYENGTLRVQGLTGQDRGFYRCLVANPMGLDLLVSQVTVTDDGSQRGIVVDGEGSGVGDVLIEKDASHSEIPSSADRTSQESRTITSDRPYPRVSSKGGSRAGHSRRRPTNRRQMWNNRRNFNKTNRKVDPQKFAELMKKAQGGSIPKTGSVTEEVKHEGPDTGLSGDGETGSGGNPNEFFILPGTMRPTAIHQERITNLPTRQQHYNSKTKTMTTTPKTEHNVTATVQSSQTADEETTERLDKVNQIGVNMITENTDPQATESYTQSNPAPMKSTFTYGPERWGEFQSDAVTPYDPVSDSMVTTSERTTKQATSEGPVTLRLTVTDTSEETELIFSGEPEPETLTGTALSFARDPNVTPMMDGPGSVEPIFHTFTDAKSHFTFTDATTTERQRDEITFHTTQMITSPQLPAGSTIISHQQIHIIPPKKGRGWGRRRNFPGRRRIIKPDRISDIQALINKLKQSSVKKEWNATVPYTMEITTDCHCDNKEKRISTNDPHFITPSVSPGSSLHSSENPVPTHDTADATTTKYYITSNAPSTYTDSRPPSSSGYTSAYVPELDSTPDAFVTPTEDKITSTTSTTTTSKVTRGRIPWNRLFGSKGRHRQTGDKRKPSIKTQPSTPKTTMAPTVSPAASPTAVSLAEPVTVPPSRYRENTQSSSGDYGDLFSADYEPISALPGLRHQTTTVTPYHTSTTAETSPVTETISSPPTVKPPSKTYLDEAVSSGSGRSPHHRLIKQRPSGAGGRLGQRRRPSGRRRPFRKRITTTAPSTTAKATTELETTMETTMKGTKQTTTLPQQTFTVSRPLYTPSRQSDRSTITVSTDRSSEEQTDSYGGVEWYNSINGSPETYTTTKTPWTTSSPSIPTITFRPTTTKRPYPTFKSIVSNIRPASGRSTEYSTEKSWTNRIRPTVSSGRTRSSSGKALTFDTMTIIRAEQGYTNTLAHFNSNDIKNGISSAKQHTTSYEATTANIVGFDLPTKDMLSKPKIVGGNAASFTVLSNSDAFLPCEAAGNPQPTISWRRFSSNTGSTITITGRMGKFEVFNNGTLAIQNANIKDRGQYLCLAESDQGSDKLLVTLSVVAYPSRILEPKMREIKSHAGSTVEMKCKAEGRPSPLVSWILANRTQVRGHSKDKERISVNLEGTLIIEHVSVYDRGHYKCIASNPAGADTATVRLQVVAAPPGILEEKRQQVRAGTSLSLWLPCTGQGNPQPTVHWVLHDGSTVRTNWPAVNPRVSVFGNGTLYIKEVALTDSGKYECIATSSTGSERRVVTLTVERRELAPRILETSQRITVLSYGDQLRLNCSASGEPKPSIIWRLPSKAVVDQWHRMGTRVHVLDNGTLIIHSVSDKDAGDYLCVARSKTGDDLQLMKVAVSMKPAKIEPKVYGKKQVPYGNDLKVDCRASGAPQPEISWGLPDGTLVNSALQSDGGSSNTMGGRTRRYVLFDNGTLYLNQVGISEEGDYTCYAENEMGKDEMHVHITVLTAAPRIRPPSQTYAKVKPGGNVRFDCEAAGEPKPKILWMLPSNDVIAASNERYLMHVNGSLDIRDAKLTDVGQYVCMARNPAGDNRKVYKLDLEGNPPVINGYHQNRTVVKDTAVKYTRKLIDCKVEGDPASTITWIMPDNIFLTAPYFGSRIIIHHNGTLEIRNVRPTDTAEFICMARNNGGEAVMVVQLEVTSMLRRPIFKNPFNERIVARLGKTAILNCSADGHPKPEIIWTLPNGTRFTSGPHRGYRHPLGTEGTFVIYNPSREDSGKYRCAAKNSMGYIEKLIVLEVGQKPYILTRPKGIIRSVSGEPLFLHCLADGNPKPSIFWTVPGGHTLTRPQVLSRYKLLENGTLVVYDATLHDRGNYVCRARNDAGESILTVPVIIIAYPPRITTWPPPNVRAMAGAPIQLNCAAIGIPKPEITWELPNHSVLSTAGQGRPLGSELLHPQGTLIIQRPTVSDSGTYRCLAKNHLGTDSKLTYVHIL